MNQLFLFRRAVIFILGMILLGSFNTYAQKRTSKVGSNLKASPTLADDRIAAMKKREISLEKSIVKDIPARCVGPTVMGGRVVDVDADPSNPNRFYVAYASGGLWFTANNGTSFQPVFDHELVMTIGDIAVDWNHGEVIWIGTGEVNSSRSSYSGVGVFKGQPTNNADGTRSWVWKHMGLSDTHHIGRIILHPDNPGIIWVAALGHLYSENEERGVFKSVDGGSNWTKVLFVNAHCGVVDLVIDPKNPDELYAAAWDRSRAAWNFKGQGEGSAVYQSLNGGASWKNISGGNSPNVTTTLFGGTPAMDIGRIGLAIYNQGGKKVLYVVLDNQHHRPVSLKESEEVVELNKDDFREMNGAKFLSLEDTLINAFLRKGGFEKGLDALNLKQRVREGTLNPIALYDYLYDANEDLFNTPVIGGEVYNYDFDHGTWSKTHDGFLDELVFTYGYYFGVIRVSPVDPNTLFIAGVPLLKSKDGGKTFTGINPDNVHVDHHALWINPRIPEHIINGSDGGVQISYDEGKTFINCNSPSVGQFYAVQVDNATPYNVYGGLQDNGVWVASSSSEVNDTWRITGHNPFTELISGDGMQVMVDTRDNQTVYTGYQFGNYFRMNTATGEQHALSVIHSLGERPLRWNWQSPILLSSFNQDILYLCSNKVHRSTDGGEHFETLSGDLTKGVVSGNVPFGTISAIAESPLQFGLLAAGSDDGLVHISKDNGYAWENVSKGLPADLWVSRVIFSSHKKSRLYVTLNGYRKDHFLPYVFVSDDFGANWKSIGTNLPGEPVNVIREDRTDENILYIGTDHGAYVSLDRGQNWMALSDDLPAVAVHDMVIQEREQELVIGTHGRSIWIMDIDVLRKINHLRDSVVALLDIPVVKRNGEWGGNWSKWLEPLIPEVNIIYNLSQAGQTPDIFITYGDSLVLREYKMLISGQGINYLPIDLAITEDAAHNLEEAMNQSEKNKSGRIKIKAADNGNYYLPEGRYEVVLSLSGRKLRTPLIIE